MHDNTRSGREALAAGSARTGARPKPHAFREAQAYRELGWPGVIPVSVHGTKMPIYTGITGNNGEDATAVLLMELIKLYGWANLGLRLPFDVIGIDVDDYDGKNGGRTFRSLNGRLGPLPTTYRSTSRAPEDSVSGIYLFRAPRKPDWKWVSDLGTGSGIEIAQYHHRFATVAPSLHNETHRPYLWWRGEREVSAPRPEELALLPVSWRRYLLSSRKYRAGGQATDAEVSEWYARVSGGPMCAGMERSARSEAAKVRLAAESGELHDTAWHAVSHLCWNAQEGCTGLGRALRIVETEFLRAKRGRNLLTEWQGHVKYAVANAAAGRQETTDACRVLSGARPRRTR